MVSLVLTIIAADRPGIVESLSSVIRDHDASWVESRMASLAGQFVGLLRVTVPEEHAGALTRALQSKSSEGVTVVVRRVDAAPTSGAKRTISLDLVGHDRAGIVADVTAVLSALSINVDELHTSQESAPMTGDALFKAQARLHVPASVDIDQLRARLEALGADLMVDIFLTEG